jgi:hypothetical protein
MGKLNHLIYYSVRAIFKHPLIAVLMSTDYMHSKNQLFSAYISNSPWNLKMESRVILECTIIPETLSAFGCIRGRYIPDSTSIHRKQEELLGQSETMQKQCFLTVMTITM